MVGKHFVVGLDTCPVAGAQTLRFPAAALRDTSFTYSNDMDIATCGL